MQIGPLVRINMGTEVIFCLKRAEKAWGHFSARPAGKQVGAVHVNLPEEILCHGAAHFQPHMGRFYCVSVTTIWGGTTIRLVFCLFHLSP